MQQNQEKASFQGLQQFQQKKDQEKCKIMGYVQNLKQKDNFFHLQKVLPVSQVLLFKMMINLIEMVIEVELRAFQLPEISLEKIMLHKKNYHLGLVYLFAPSNQINQGNTFQQIKRISIDCYILVMNLSFHREIYQSAKNLRDLSDALWDKLLIFEIDEQHRNQVFELPNFSRFLAKMFGIQHEESYYNKDQIVLFVSQNHSLIEVPDNKKLAIKFTKDNSQQQRREIFILEKLDSSYASKLYCYMNYKQNIVMVLKFHDDILKNIQEKQQEFTQDQQLVSKFLVYYLRKIMRSLRKHHEQGVTHQDLKPKKFKFNFAKHLQTINDYLNTVNIDSKAEDTNILSSYLGNQNYKPPEGKLNKYSPSFDIYQVGMMLLLTTFYDKQYFDKCFKKHRFRPLSASSHNKLIQKICSCDQKITISDQLMNLIKSMVRHKPEERPSVQEVIKSLNMILL